MPKQTVHTEEEFQKARGGKRVQIDISEEDRVLYRNLVNQLTPDKPVATLELEEGEPAPDIALKYRAVAEEQGKRVVFNPYRPNSTRLVVRLRTPELEQQIKDRTEKRKSTAQATDFRQAE